jgi:O-6-methylguanine DNA methyltransferase
MHHFVWSSFTSQIGVVYIASTEKGVCKISIPGQTKKEFLAWMEKKAEGGSIMESKRKHKVVVDQLNRYFSRKLVKFNVRLDPIGTEFQRDVWKALRKVRYGTTISYADLSKRIGIPNGAQSVGRANGANPIPIIIPCHRVIGSDSRLVGYAAGIKTKEFLLRLEGALLV